MKKSMVVIKRNTCLYNGEEYNYDAVRDILNLNQSDIKIIILEEELYAKHFRKEIKRSKLQFFVNNIINNDFIQNGDILYDFDMKNNLVAIYSIKGAKRVEALTENAVNLEIIPIQFIVKDIMFKYLKNIYLTCNILIKFREFYYYVRLKDGLFLCGFVENNENRILEKIYNDENSGEIYIDISVNSKELENKYTVVKINIGDLINEKIYKKQRFHFRKIL